MSQNQDKNHTFSALFNIISKSQNETRIAGLDGSAKAYVLFRYYAKRRIPVLVVVRSVREADKFARDFAFFSGGKAPVMIFPQYNISPVRSVLNRSDIESERIRTLYKLANSGPPVLVTTPGALLRKLIPKRELFGFSELVMAGEETSRELLIEKLISGGYSRVLMVEDPGDYCVRGGILDVYTPFYQDPLRLEFAGDTVESIRFFSASSQRTLKAVHEAVIIPAKEAVFKNEDLNDIIGRIREQMADVEMPVTAARELIDSIKRDLVLPEIENLIPLIYPDPASLFDYLPENILFIMDEPEELRKSAHEFLEQESKNYMSARDQKRLCVETERTHLSWEEANGIIKERKHLILRATGTYTGDETKDPAVNCSGFIENNDKLTQNLVSGVQRENHLTPLAEWIAEKMNLRCAVTIVCSTGSQSERIRALLLPYGIQAEIMKGFPEIHDAGIGVRICLGTVSSGFIWPEESLAVITEDEIFGAKHRRRKQPTGKTLSGLLSFENLKKGDLVVHDEHGIGRYGGLVKLKLNGSTNDFLLIVYRDDDKLYLPVDRMNIVNKYSGIEGIDPVLDKMGGKSWEKVKERVKKSAEKIAGELLELYALRKINEGFSFGKPDSYFKDFEAGFPYEETQDQLKAIEDVLDDMEKANPMDRLVCGDVGYGKTEVALRASFLAVSGGKQVAVLVPTTVLAEQHFSVFTERFRRYPVEIACLSRFRSSKEQKEIVLNLASGKTDIVVGTHRLLQKDVVFRDLGLVVLDEEQRFGVRHKEKLKNLRNIVDVLALTATPIPRTLHMSLMGIRDISVISTPPEHRHPIITYVSEFDEAVIEGAIRKELARKGQIFFVHNNIYTIEAMARRLQDLVPEARTAIAHGKLGEDELESVIYKFMKKETDMLICTTIIESGIDIPSANTIIINRADKFGLAQIYQLRGRVGRSDEQAYAYLFIPKESALGKDAEKRLKVLMEHSDLGSGFQIAMNDLRIRGGGTILGASQSGHIAAVGYDMFLKLMENAVSELKGEPVKTRIDPEINIPVSAFLPESYVPDIDQRLTSYRRLARMTELAEIADFKKELVDRFGALPGEATNLLLKVMLKILSHKAGIKRLEICDMQILLHFADDEKIKNPSGVIDMVIANKERFEFAPGHILKIKLPKQSVAGHILYAKNILKEIHQRVNC
jgi:transcription-repair coupling factor (superfamily II helicase)